jgi:hypothetical protein
MPRIHLYSLAKREKADHWMRDRFRELWSPGLPIPKLYGICAMGTCFAVYQYSKEMNCISPYWIPRNQNVMNDAAPQTRWEYELLETGGEEKLRSIVAEVKDMAQAIIDHECKPYSFVVHADVDCDFRID